MNNINTYTVYTLACSGICVFGYNNIFLQYKPNSVFCGIVSRQSWNSIYRLWKFFFLRVSNQTKCSDVYVMIMTNVIRFWVSGRFWRSLAVGKFSSRNYSMLHELFISAFIEHYLIKDGRRIQNHRERTTLHWGWNKLWSMESTQLTKRYRFFLK